MTTRIGMWSAVASRKHTVVHVFPFDDSNTFMLHGVVALGLRNGANVDVDWAARAQVVKCPDEKYRMQFYQVYLVRTANCIFVPNPHPGHCSHCGKELD